MAGSMTKSAAGSDPMFLRPPRYFSKRSRSFSRRETSFFVMDMYVPSSFIRSSWRMRSRPVLMVRKLVSVPPSQRLTTKKLPERTASSRTISWAWRLVPTIRMWPPRATVSTTNW